MNEEERLELEQELLLTCSKAQAINKYIDECSENSILTEQWLKSQTEKRELQQRIDKAIEYIKEKERNNCWIGQYDACDLIKILKGE